METVWEIIVVPVVTQVQVDTGWVERMKELAIFFVGTQRGTNSRSGVHSAVWRTHLEAAILSQHLREFGIKRLDYLSLCASFEFHDVILCNCDGHGTRKTLGDANFPSPCGHHSVEHKFTLHVDGVNRRVDPLRKASAAASGRRIGSPIRWWRAHDTLQTRSIGVGQFPTGIGTNELRSAQTQLRDEFMRHPCPSSRKKTSRRCHIAHKRRLGFREKFWPLFQFLFG